MSFTRMWMFELLRTHTAVLCSSCVSWGLGALCQVHSTRVDLRAACISECFPPPPDLFTSQMGTGRLWASFQKPLNWCLHTAKLNGYIHLVLSTLVFALHEVFASPLLLLGEPPMPPGLLSIKQSRKYLSRKKAELKSDTAILVSGWYQYHLPRAF